MAAELAGEPQLLSTREVAKLMAARARYHVTPPPAAAPICRKPATTAKSSADEVTLTRSELDALVDEAVRKDRARR